ncbi:GNAT family N-acetyltransferase [Nocardioides montaniterrae]
MLWRVRAKLSDRPGALAALAAACGRAEANILTVHIFPEGGSVTDELVVDLPTGAGLATIDALVTDADGRLVSAAPCSPAAADDQPTRYVRAAQEILEEPARFPEIAAELFDAAVGIEGDADVLEMAVGEVATVQVRRTVPFTPVERARAAALADLLGRVLDSRITSRSRRTFGSALEYVAEGATVSALAGGLVAGRASYEVAEGPWPVDIWVDPAWQRRGIGARLLKEIARAARSADAEELLLIAPADSKAALPMVLSAGMRGRIRVADGVLTLRISLAELRVAAGIG